MSLNTLDPVAIVAYQVGGTRFGLRFGGNLRSLTAGLFLVTRASVEEVRVFAVVIVIRVAHGRHLTGLSDYERDVAALALVTVLRLLYTFERGMAAVIWTDVVQLTIYLIGTLAAAFSIVRLADIAQAVFCLKPTGVCRTEEFECN
jgi:Na+/proline symporter